MSMITRCPACGTMFNVVTDQLKVSQGWVRCGQCATVFDASLHLQVERAHQPDQAAPYVEPVVYPGAPVVDITPSTSSFSAKSGTPEAADSSYAEEISAALKATDTALAEPSSVDALTPFPQAPQNSIYPPENVPDQMPADVSFVRDARRQAFWRRPVTRALLLFLALILMVLLALQFAVQQRDKMAVFEPRLRPALQMLCEALACNVGPVRQIEAIVIDNSSFNKVNDSVYRLSFSIKNTATTAVAMPSLEVTLTDTQDQAVIRRVLAPAQLGMATGLLGASTDFSGVLTLQLTALETSREAASAPLGTSIARRVAGYRLLAFYP